MHFFTFNDPIYPINLLRILLIVKLNKSCNYLIFGYKLFWSATITVNNNFPISLPFYDFFLLQDSLINPLSLIYLLSWRGYPPVSHITKYCTCSFIILLASEISFSFIFQYRMDLYSQIKKDETHSELISCLISLFLVTILLLYPHVNIL